MFPNANGQNKPKLEEAVENVIYNNSRRIPSEILIYAYRKEFGLTAAELLEEPIDQFNVNMMIRGHINKKESLEAKHGSS